jgi:hypothetical protein
MSPEEKATQGLSLLKNAIKEVIANHPEGITNAEIAKVLGIQSDYKGANHDYLSWSILGLLLNAGEVGRRGRKYFSPTS